MVKIEIYEKGITYHSALTLEVTVEELRALDKILRATGNAYRVTPIDDGKGAKDDF